MLPATCRVLTLLRQRLLLLFANIRRDINPVTALFKNFALLLFLLNRKLATLILF